MTEMGTSRPNLLASLYSDSLVLWHLLRGQSAKAEDHAASLQRFYAPQAEHYDHFRERLLQGRRELIDRLAPPPAATVVELGGGTGRNLEFFGPRMLSLERVDVVDICPALLEVARKRCAQWPGVARAIMADATQFRPEWPADRVYFSYSLTMMPDWRAAIENAVRMLKPGGLLGVVDFYVSGHAPPPGFVRHSFLTRRFWPRWFAHSGVHPSAEHLPALREYTRLVHCSEHMASIPYLPGLEVPYYLYIGRKRTR